MAFSEELIQQVWEKARVMTDQDGAEWRKDECGAWLQREAYNQEHSEFGWMIINTSIGGTDDFGNLRPLHYRNTFDRANGKAHCHVTSDRAGGQTTGHIDHPANRTEGK